MKTFITAFIVFFPCMDINTLWHRAITYSVIDFSNNIFNRFLYLFNSMNFFVTHQQKCICLFFAGNFAELIRGFALRTFTIPFVERYPSILCTQNLPENIAIGEYTLPITSILLLSYRHSGMSVLNIEIAVIFFKIICNVISFQANVVIFAMVNVDTFSVIKVIAA